MQLARLAACSIVVVILGLTVPVNSMAQEPQIEFQDWLTTLIVEARERGIREEIIDEALRDVTPTPQVVTNDRNQSNTSKSASLSGVSIPAARVLPSIMNC